MFRIRHMALIHTQTQAALWALVRKRSIASSGSLVCGRRAINISIGIRVGAGKVITILINFRSCPGQALRGLHSDRKCTWFSDADFPRKWQSQPKNLAAGGCHSIKWPCPTSVARRLLKTTTVVKWKWSCSKLRRTNTHTQAHSHTQTHSYPQMFSHGHGC